MYPSLNSWPLERLITVYPSLNSWPLGRLVTVHSSLNSWPLGRLVTVYPSLNSWPLGRFVTVYPSLNSWPLERVRNLWLLNIKQRFKYWKYRITKHHDTNRDGVSRPVYMDPNRILCYTQFYADCYGHCIGSCFSPYRNCLSDGTQTDRHS
jgi:hypothetical protein